MANLDDLDLQAIGKAVVACARIEGMVRPVLAALMNVQEGMAQIAFSDRGHAWVLDALEDAAKLGVDDLDLQNEWVRWVRDARRVNARRNGIVHAQWLTPAAFGSDPMVSARFITQGRREGLSRRRRGLSMEFSTRRSLTALATAAGNLSRQLSGLVHKTPGLLVERGRN